MKFFQYILITIFLQCNLYIVKSQDFNFTLSQNFPSLLGPDHTLGSGGSLLQLPDGKILQFFRLDPGYNGNHVGNSGAIAKRYSIDAGKTWSQPTIIFDDEFDDRFSTSYRLDNGDIVVTFFRYFCYDTWNGVYVDTYMIISQDDGATWSDKLIIQNISPTSCFQNVFKIAGKDGYFASTYSTSYVDLRYSPDGYNWDSVYYKWDYRLNPSMIINEPFFASLGGGKLIGLFRVENQPIHQVVSYDYGVTWSPIEKTNLGDGFFCPAPTIYYDSLFNKIVTVFTDRRGTAYDFNNLNSGVWVYFSDPDSVLQNPLAYNNYNFLVRAYPDIFRMLGYASTTKISDNTYLIVYSDSYKKTNGLEDAEYFQFYVTINKHPQTISFDTIPKLEYADIDILPKVLASSSLPISLISSDTTIAKIVDNKIKVLKPGICDIYAYQYGNHIYDTAFTSIQLEIIRANQNIDLKPIEQFVYGQGSINLPNLSNVNLPLHYEISDTSIINFVNGEFQIVGAGICEINSIQDGNIFYNPLKKTQVISIQKAPQDFPFSPNNHVKYGDHDMPIILETNVGLPITYTSSDTNVIKIINDKISIVGSGICELIAIQDGNSFYNPVYKSKVISVEKAIQDFNFIPNDHYTFGDNNVSFIEHTNVNLPLKYESSDTSIIKFIDGKMNIVGAGFCQITAIQEGNNLYNPIFKSEFITIDKAQQNIDFKPIENITYGDNSIELPKYSESNLPLVYESSDTSIIKIIDNSIHVVGAGICNIYLKQNGDRLYKPYFESQTIEINKATQAIDVFPFNTIHYGQNDLFIKENSTVNLPVIYESADTSIIIIKNGKLIPVGVGKCEITAIQNGNNLYTPYSFTKEVIVEKSFQTLNFEKIVMTWSDSNYSPKVESTSGLPITLGSTDTTIAKIIDGKIYPIKPGICYIYAEQEGNEFYYGTEKSYEKLIILSTNINKPLSQDNILYPNPTNGSITIKNGENSLIEIYSSNGKCVLKTQLFNENSIDLSRFSNGNYIVKIISKDTIKTIPLLLKK